MFNIIYYITKPFDRQVQQKHSYLEKSMLSNKHMIGSDIIDIFIENKDIDKLETWEFRIFIIDLACKLFSIEACTFFSIGIQNDHFVCI